MTRAKLIRDRVPVDDGGTELPSATGRERLRLLGAKLEEEASEAHAALAGHLELADDPAAVTAELADLVEVARAVADHLPGGWAKVERVRRAKLTTRGGFALGRRYAPPRRVTP